MLISPVGKIIKQVEIDRNSSLSVSWTHDHTPASLSDTHQPTGTCGGSRLPRHPLVPGAPGFETTLFRRALIWNQLSFPKDPPPITSIRSPPQCGSRVTPPRFPTFLSLQMSKCVLPLQDASARWNQCVLASLQPTPAWKNILRGAAAGFTGLDSTRIPMA